MILKQMMKKLMAGILISAMLISGGYVAPEPRTVQAAGGTLTVEYRAEEQDGGHVSLEDATNEALETEGKQPGDYSGIVVKGDNVMNGDDFTYLNDNWSHATTIDLGGISVEGNVMGQECSFDDEDGNYVEGAEQMIGSQTIPSDSSEAVQVKTLALPNSLATLDRGALRQLPNLEEVEIPASVTEVYEDALYELPALKKVSYHGTDMTYIDGTIFSYEYDFPALTLDFSDASGLDTVDMSKNIMDEDIVSCDFTGCTNLTYVDLSGMCLDFSGGKEKEWLDSYEYEYIIDGQKPKLTFSAESVGPLKQNETFLGPPALQGILSDGTDVLAEDAPIPDWIDPDYISNLKAITPEYFKPSGDQDYNYTIDTSIGGTHTIRWTFEYVENPLIEGTTYELQVEVQHVQVIIPESEKKETVYLGAPSSSEEGAITKTNISDAIGYLKDGGTLCLQTNATLPKDVELPENMTIDGSKKEGAPPVLTLSDDLSLASDLTLDNVKLEAATTEDVTLYANGHKFTSMGDAEESASVRAATRETFWGQAKVNVYGGGKDTVTGDTSLILTNGTFGDVYGGDYISVGSDYNGGNDGTVSGNKNIQIGGNVKIENVYGGNYSIASGTANTGDTKMTISGGQIGTLYGGGHAECLSATDDAEKETYTETTTENTDITITGDADITTVYGGGYAGSADNADIKGDVKLTISGGTVDTIFGGGYVFSNPDAHAKVLGEVYIDYQGGDVKHIYGAGQYKEFGNEETLENAGVVGNVSIHAKGGDLEKIERLGGKGPDGGKVMGDANIILEEYDTPTVVPTLYHFDNLVLNNSRIIFPKNVWPNLSCDENDDCNIEMKNNSTIEFERLALDDPFAINNLTTDGPASLTLGVTDGRDNTIPLTINGKVSAPQRITLCLTNKGKAPAVRDIVFDTTNVGGNDSLLSSKFDLQNTEFKLIKKNGKLVLVDSSSNEKEDQDQPSGLSGIAPSGYGKGDGEISGITEDMEYATRADGPYEKWKRGKKFEAGTYYVRYAATETKNESRAVEVEVPVGQHNITYQVKDAVLSEDAPKKVANGESFTFTCTPNSGWRWEASGYSVTSGEITREGDTFTVENVQDDVKVTLVATEIPGRAKIKKQPHDVTVRSGHTAVFEVEATGDEPISYQWQRKKGDGEFEIIDGETNSTLTTGVAGESTNGYQYRCIVANAHGSVTSEAATLHVIAAGETVVAQEQDNAILGADEEIHVKIGEPLSLTIEGAGMDNKKPAQGDTRFVPQSWMVEDQTGSWKNAPYTVEIKTDKLSPGQHTITIFFMEQRFNGKEWEPTGNKVSKTFTIWLDEKKDNNPQKPEKPDDGSGGDDGDGNGAATTTPSGKDDEPQTSDVQPIEIYATLSMIAGLSYLLLEFGDRRRGMSEREKKQITAAIVAWGKKGGRLRRMAAIVMLFVLLLYYHSIGKRMDFRLCVYNINAAHLRRCRCTK